MQTVILCGGLGTRLREETEYRPKPMVNVGNRPILWHIMKIFSQYGFKEFILTLGFKGEMIKDFFCHYEIMNNDVTIELGNPDSIEIHNNHEEAGWKITLADTGYNTLKGGRIKRIEKYIDGQTFLLTYGDGLADVDLKKLLKFHRSHKKIATLTGISPSAQFGELRLDGNQVKAFQEKPKTTLNKAWVNGGFFVLDRRIFDYLEEDETCDFEFGALEQLACEDELMVYQHYGFWACMDTIRDTERLNKLWNAGNAAWKIW